LSQQNQKLKQKRRHDAKTKEVL